MPKKEKKPIDLGSFVKVWTRAASLEAVAKHFGVPKQAVSIKATILRKKGVKMRKFDRGVAASPKPKWTVDELNKIISEAPHFQLNLGQAQAERQPWSKSPRHSRRRVLQHVLGRQKRYNIYDIVRGIFREVHGMTGRKPIDLRRVVITGVGMVTSMGLDVPTVWPRLLAGESGIKKLSTYADDFITRYKAPDDFPVIGGEATDFDLKEILQARKKDLTKEDLKQIKYTDRFTQFALAASLEAIQDSGLDLEVEDPDRAGVIIASGMGGVGSGKSPCTG